MVSHITHYLHMTKELRGQNCQLLITFIKPNNPVFNSTIGKWVKSILDGPGTDVTKFSENSAGPTATSYGTHTGLTLQEILKTRGWSNAQTFATYYNKPTETSFGASILEHFRGTQCVTQWIVHCYHSCYDPLKLLFLYTIHSYFTCLCFQGFKISCNSILTWTDVEVEF